MAKSKGGDTLERLRRFLPRDRHCADLSALSPRELAALQRVAAHQTGDVDAMEYRDPRDLKTVTVDSPTVAGAVDRVSAALNTVDLMYRRKQISFEQHQAALKIRAAYDILEGSPGGAMDFERARGGALPGSSPALAALKAADVWNEVKSRLYDIDYALIVMVACQGRTIAEAAEQLAGRKVSRTEWNDAAKAMKNGLREMAKVWFVRPSRHQGITTSFALGTDPRERPYTAEAGSVVQGRVAHATRKSVAYSGRRRKQ